MKKQSVVGLSSVCLVLSLVGCGKDQPIPPMTNGTMAPAQNVVKLAVQTGQVPAQVPAQTGKTGTISDLNGEWERNLTQCNSGQDTLKDGVDFSFYINGTYAEALLEVSMGGSSQGSGTLLVTVPLQLTDLGNNQAAVQSGIGPVGCINLGSATSANCYAYTQTFSPGWMPSQLTYSRVGSALTLLMDNDIMCGLANTPGKGSEATFNLVQ